MMHDRKEPGQKVVVVSQVLAADINIGYEEIVNTMVKGFNGKPVNNLKQLAKMVETCKEEYLRFELDHEILVVLKTKDALKETREILKVHAPQRQVRGSAVRRRETRARRARDDTNDARANDVCARGALHKDRPASPATAVVDYQYRDFPTRIRYFHASPRKPQSLIRTEAAPV